MQKNERIGDIDPAMKTEGPPAEVVRWHSPMDAPFSLSGFPWIAQDKVYRRLPVHPRWKIPQSVDSLANHTAGGQIRFRTDSGKLALRVELRGAADMYHMPSTGQCGFDCYLGEHPRQSYCGTTRYDHRETRYGCEVYAFGSRAMRAVTLNFPLYQGVKEVSVGLDPGAEILEPSPYLADRRVIFYGTSITQGGCAARPGMAYTNILSRRLNLECVNLGFSGNGRGEPELARLIAEIDSPACVVLDYEANAPGDLMERTLPEFIRILREGRPVVPILVVSKIAFAREMHDDAAREHTRRLRGFQRDTVAALREAGDPNTHFCDGSTLIGAEAHECTVDGVHPTDLGFWSMANGIEPALRRILFSDGHGL